MNLGKQTVANIPGHAMDGKEFGFWKWKRTIYINKTYHVELLKCVRQYANCFWDVMLFHLIFVKIMQGKYLHLGILFLKGLIQK